MAGIDCTTSDAFSRTAARRSEIESTRTVSVAALLETYILPKSIGISITLSRDIGHFVDVPQLQSLRVLVWSDYNKNALLDDHTDNFTGLTFSTALHGGFKLCSLSVPMSLERLWLYFERENLAGRHFAHLEILEEQKIVWEGRIMAVGFDPSGANLSFNIEAAGYWSSCRDQFYDSADSGNTDWTSGSHTVDDIIKEMLTEECPDINSDQTNIDDPGSLC